MVAACLLDAFPTLTPDDVRSIGMGQAGDDIQLSARAKDLITYAMECKNQEKLNIWAAVDQCARRSDGTMTSIVVIKRNNVSPHVLVPLEEFIRLISAPAGTGVPVGEILAHLDKIKDCLMCSHRTIPTPCDDGGLECMEGVSVVEGDVGTKSSPE